MNTAPLQCDFPEVLQKNGHGPSPEKLQVDQFVAEGHHVQELVARLDRLPDHAARDIAHDCIQAMLALHGHGLERLLQLTEKDSAQREIFLNDKIICGLLLIHGLHPVDLRARLLQALDKVKPYMATHGGNVELLSLDNGFARLRLQGTCKGCPSSAITLDLSVRHAIEEACPDLAGFEVEGAVAEAEPHEEKVPA